MAATFLLAGPCVVTNLKDANKVQLGFGRKNKPSKPVAGFFKKIGLKDCSKNLREAYKEEAEKLEVGQEIKVSDVFKEGDLVSVTGISKGKGFSGVVKRWNFKGGPKTHGQSDRQRAPGSSGSTTTPGRVFKGKKMAGKTGANKKTIDNLEVLKIDQENNILVVKGAVPGIRGSLLVVNKN